MIGNREQDIGFATGPSWQPHVTHAGCIRQPWVKRNNLGPIHLGFDNTLRVWVKVVTGFQVARNEHNHARIGMIWARAIKCPPQIVARSCASRTNVRMAIMCINTPGRNTTVRIAIFAGTPDMIHDPITATCSTFTHLFRDLI